MSIAERKNEILEMLRQWGWFNTGLFVLNGLLATASKGQARYTPLPANRSVWDFDVYVAPDFRLGLAFLRLWDQANSLLLENDISWSCSRISAFNAGSLAAHARLGTVFLVVPFFCAGECQLTFASISPYFHFSRQPDSFPEFILDTLAL